jgi:transcriptional regulator with XRE-family HTH domain
MEHRLIPFALKVMISGMRHAMLSVRTENGGGAVGIDLFPGITKPTSHDRLGIELADEQLGMIFGIRRVRLERGLSISEVAEAMKVDPAQVSRLESGATNPTMATLRRYAKAVGAIFRVQTRHWRDEQSRMVMRSVEAWESGDEGNSSPAEAAPQFHLKLRSAAR